MNRLSELAVGRRSVSLLLAAALFIAGVVAWGNLKQELLPEVSFPIVTIVAPYPGAGAADVAEQVAKPLERAVASLPGLDEVRSTSANSLAFVIAQFDYGTDVDEAVRSIEEQVARAGLPAGVEPTITALNLNAAPVLIASISASAGTDLETAAAIARDEVVPELLSVRGVAAADLAGGLEERLVVTLEPDALAASGVSIDQISGVLRANNLTIPGGQVPSADGRRIPVSTIGRFSSIEQLQGLVVGARPAAAPGGVPTPITLSEVGSVELKRIATTGFGRTNGQPAVTISISKTSSANTVDVAKDAAAKLAEIAARHPGQITIVSVSDQSTFILESSEGLLREGGLGAVFAVLTIFFFLFNLRSTIVAAISIPLSILTALVVMQLAGITLNILTLGGLAVAIGRVVDDSIVVLENIYRHRALGHDRLTSVLAGPREVAGAITASTFTTVAVFLPLGFAGGFISQFFQAFALTVTFALLASLIVALTIVPVLAYLFVGRVSEKVDETGEPRNSPWVRIYDPVIRFVLRSRATRLATVAAAGVLFVASLALVPLLPTGFISSGSEKVLQVTVAPPVGASSEQVLEQAAAAEGLLLALPQVELVSTTVPGEGDASIQTIFAAQQGQAANSARLVVRLHPSVNLQAETTALSDLLAPLQQNGYTVTVGQQGGGATNTLSVVVRAEDPAVVASATEAVMTALADEPGLANLSSDLVRAAPEIQVRVDPAKAAATGLTAAQIGASVRSALTGSPIGLFAIGDARPVSLVVQIEPGRFASAEDLRALLVGTVVKVPLGTIATVEQVDVQGRITRIGEAPSATVNAEVTSGNTGATSLAVRQEIERLRASGAIPPGADVALGGITEQQTEAFGGLFVAMGVAILLVYLMLVLAFNSLLTPFIILFSLPLATIGAFPALLLTGRPIGISALIGFLMLIGIVVTNAIVLLDLVEKLRAEGHSTRDALIEGGRTRLRPILMTAMATILALVPLAAGLNEGSIIAAELGTVVIGGLLSSTLLTLVVVPVVYSLVEGLPGRARRHERPASA